MQQARRSSVPKVPASSDAHSPSEGSPTARTKDPKAAKQARSSSKPTAKDPRAASPIKGSRGAAASAGAKASSPATPKGAPNSQGRETAQAQALAPRNPAAAAAFHSQPSTLPTPRARFAAWVATHASEDEASEALCDQIAEGSSLLAFCKTNGFSYSSVSRWIYDERAPERAVNYARAREDRADALADEIVAISEEDRFVRAIDNETGEVADVTFDATAVQRNRLRVDARKWVAAKMKPRVYGEKVAVGGDPDAPAIQTSHTVTFVSAQKAVQLVEEVRAERLEDQS
jgi:hypothetical protein